MPLSEKQKEALAKAKAQTAQQMSQHSKKQAQFNKKIDKDISDLHQSSQVLDKVCTKLTGDHNTHEGE